MKRRRFFQLTSTGAAGLSLASASKPFGSNTGIKDSEAGIPTE